MELTDYKVKRIIYPHEELRRGKPAEIIDGADFIVSPALILLTSSRLGRLRKMRIVWKSQ